MGEQPLGTVTFLFTDIEGSTRLWEERPDEMQVSLAEHDSAVRAAVEVHGGYVFATGGDGFIDGLRSGGLDVPGDVLLTGFDGLPQASWAGYDLTTLVQPVEVLVDETLAIIFDAPGDVGQPVRIMPGTLREGNTTRRTNA